MNAKLNGNVVEIEFDGVDDLMKTANRYKEPKFDRVSSRWDKCFTRGNDWNGHSTLKKVGEALLVPTPKMNAVITTGDALFDSEDWATEKPRRKIKRRLEDGDEIDVERWMDREPDMWEESKKVKGPRFGVRIGVNVSTSAYVGTDGFKWRTSAVVAILNICEELHIPCEVVCYEATRNYAYVNGNVVNCNLSFPVKRPEHLLDIDLLGYVLGDKSFFRVAILGAEIIATTDTFGDRAEIKDGLGTPHEWDKPSANEFILSRACLKESVAREEVARFKNWLVSIRERSRYNLDGLE